jgi:hypothetical protein
MKKIETQITIAARPEQVWAVLMDFDAYSEWNPFLISIKGEAVAGTRLRNEIKLNVKKTMEFKPEVLVVDEFREFRWIGSAFVKGLFDGEHYFRLVPNNDGTTDLIHGELFTGLLAGMVMKMSGEDTRRGFLAMNDALKARVEAKGAEV